MIDQFRLANEGDLSAIIQLDQTANPHPWGASLIKQSFTQGQRRLNWVALDDKQQVCAWLTAANVLDESELELIMVSPLFRRQGVAQSLIQNWILEVQSIPVTVCLLEVRESNLAARHLYEKLGFIQVGSRKNYYSTTTGKEAAILMNLTLSKD